MARTKAQIDQQRAEIQQAVTELGKLEGELSFQAALLQRGHAGEKVENDQDLKTTAIDTEVKAQMDKFSKGVSIVD